MGFFTGIQPSATYGGEVMGYTPQEIRVLRKAASRALGFPRAGSMELGWQLYPLKDPLKVAASTMRRYCQEWWQASGPQLIQGDGLSVRELSGVFHTTLRHFHGQPAKASWLKKSTGPMADLHLWMREAGWEVVSPGQFLTRSGKPMILTDHAPHIVAKAFVDDLRGV